MLGFVFTFFGAACLSMAVKRHYHQLFPNRAPNKATRILWRSIGFAALALGLYASIIGLGTAVGITAFVAYLNVGIFAVAMGLSAHAVRAGSSHKSNNRH